MKTNYLVLGATGGIGYGFTKALIEQGKSATLLVRSKEKAIRYFGLHEHIQLVEGDAQNTELLMELAKDVDYIFHGLSVSYQHWATFMPAITRKIVSAGVQNQATIIFPGNNYNYGPAQTPITELTPFNPNNPLGEVRVAIEQYLLASSQAGKVKTLIVRLPELWGPGVANKSIAPIFENVQVGKAMPWVFRTDQPQQLAYNLDAGQLMLNLTEELTANFEVYNYSGTSFESIKAWFQQIAIIADKPFRQMVLSKRMIQLLALFSPVMAAMKKLDYKWEHTILLDDSKLRRAGFDVQKTPIAVAITDTLNWFKLHGSVNERAQKENRRKKRKQLIIFLADNLAIGLFPLLLALLGRLIPFIEMQAVLFGVVAGIYWTPALRSGLLRVLASKWNL